MYKRCICKDDYKEIDNVCKEKCHYSCDKCLTDSTFADDCEICPSGFGRATDPVDNYCKCLEDQFKDVGNKMCCLKKCKNCINLTECTECDES